jgi:hypothetical protein
MAVRLLQHGVKRFPDRGGRDHPHIAGPGLGHSGRRELGIGEKSRRQDHGGSHDCGQYFHRTLSMRLAPASGAFWAAAVPAARVANQAKSIHFAIPFKAFSLDEIIAEGNRGR